MEETLELLFLASRCNHTCTMGQAQSMVTTVALEAIAPLALAFFHFNRSPATREAFAGQSLAG